MIKRFDCSKVRGSHHLVETPLKTIAHIKREYQKALDVADGKIVVTVRDYLPLPVKADFAPRGFGRKIKRLNHEKRWLVLLRAEAEARRIALRNEMLASLRR